jgi:hypothetical protein
MWKNFYLGWVRGSGDSHSTSFREFGDSPRIFFSENELFQGNPVGTRGLPGQFGGWAVRVLRFDGSTVRRLGGSTVRRFDGTAVGGWVVRRFGYCGWAVWRFDGSGHSD